MEQNPAAFRRSLWHPALPYALDYIGLVLATAYLSILWFTGRLNSLYLAVPLGVAFTVLASRIYYRWQHGRWLRRKHQLELAALRLWLEDELLSGTVETLRSLVCDLLTSQEGYIARQASGHPLFTLDGRTYRLICLRRHPSCPADAQLLMQLAAASRAHTLIVVSTAAFTDAARAYAEKQSIRLLVPSDLAVLAQKAGMTIPAGQKAVYLRKACQERRSQRQSLLARVRRTRTLRYLSGAVLLGLMGILSPWRGWYWLMALYCAIMGTAGWLSAKGRRADRS